MAGVLLFLKNFRRFAAGFCCFQKFPPPAAGVYCCPKIHIFVADFHRFCLEKAQNFSAASRRGVFFRTSASKKNSTDFFASFLAPSRRGVFFRTSAYKKKIDRFFCLVFGAAASRRRVFLEPQHLKKTLSIFWPIFDLPTYPYPIFYLY